MELPIDITAIVLDGLDLGESFVPHSTLGKIFQAAGITVLVHLGVGGEERFWLGEIDRHSGRKYPFFRRLLKAAPNQAFHGRRNILRCGGNLRRVLLQGNGRVHVTGAGAGRDG